jgi:hypothetical protein
MTYRERILAAIRGETPDRLPFVPRLEFRVRAQRHAQALPPEFRSLTLMEIADRLGVGYYAVVPDFTDYSGDEMANRALGIIRLAVLPFRISLEGCAPSSLKLRSADSCRVPNTGRQDSHGLRVYAGDDRFRCFRCLRHRARDPRTP